MILYLYHITVVAGVVQNLEHTSTKYFESIQMEVNTCSHVLKLYHKILHEGWVGMEVPPASIYVITNIQITLKKWTNVWDFGVLVNQHKSFNRSSYAIDQYITALVILVGHFLDPQPRHRLHILCVSHCLLVSGIQSQGQTWDYISNRIQGHIIKENLVVNRQKRERVRPR